MGVKNKLKEIRMREFMMEPLEFAEYLEVNKKSYYQWESGISKPPLEKALNIALKLNRNVNDIWYLE
jgi:DNA-binding XRE family transcriptional regulator